MYHFVKGNQGFPLNPSFFILNTNANKGVFFQKFGQIYHKFKNHEDTQPDKK